MAQLMVVLDATVVNIALPHAQAALHISNDNRQWVVTAYSLAFGGLLLLGGRIADFTGRKRAFLIGIVGFAAASAVGGLATSEAMLFASRAFQGAFAALLAPAALSILTITFEHGSARAKAFGVYGAISAGGAAVGLLLGGILTQYASWRWTLLINAPIAILAGLAALRFVPESKAAGDTRYDIPGAISVTGGLAALVFGFAKASTDGWASATTLVSIALGVVLLFTFAISERRSSHPLMPLRIPLQRNRGGSYLATLAIGAGIIGAFLFLIYYMQVVKHYSPITTGLATLPITGIIVIAAGIATALLRRVGPRIIMTVGSTIGAAGMLLLAQSTVSSAYTHILASELIFGFGLGLAFTPLQNTATHGVANDDAGVASALTNATQQIGGALGAALFNTFYATAVTSYLASHAHSSVVQIHALVHGYDTAFLWSAGALALGAIVSFVLIQTHPADGRETTADEAAAQPASAQSILATT
jgi:EmrB/QacA subfamily drug resistance transporter